MSNLSEAISEMRNMRESYDQIGAAAEAYNTGKTQLAQAITSKGVETSPTETYPEMAEKVAQIPLVTTTIDGGEMYAAQQFGDGALWNLYQVLADMKTRFMGNGDYAALIVCEYYKGYDSLQLQGADAYYTCDGDLYEYASPNHVWHDADNGKMNRWVAFLYRDEGARLDITNTAISPRSMYIGGHIGTIEYFVNGRLTELVCGVEETDVVDNFLQKTYSQNFIPACTMRNIRYAQGITSGNGTCLIVNFTQGTSLDISGKSIIISNSREVVEISGIVEVYGTPDNNCGLVESNFAQTRALVINDLKIVRSTNIFLYMRYRNALEELRIKDLEYLENGTLYADLYENKSNIIDIEVGLMRTNLGVVFWNPKNVLADSDKKAQLIENIKNHILARVSDATGGTQLVFTVSTNMYNNIASEQIEWQGEMMSLADAFLTKNWLLAGA